jgi:hypothetical protein
MIDIREVISKNDHSEAFFRRLFTFIEQFKKENPESLSILGSIIADYKKPTSSFWTLRHDGELFSSFLPPKKCVTERGKKIQIKGLEQILSYRLKLLGAVAHLKTISRCSEWSLWLYQDSGNLVASYNLPCRKPSCPYCSHLAKRGSAVLDRSQAISERGKKHLRYCLVGGAAKFYGRLIFTLPNIIQQQVDRKDLKNWECYGEVRVYGDKFSRELAEINDEKENELTSIESDEEKAKIDHKHRERIYRKVKRAERVEKLETRLLQVKEKIKKLYEEKHEGTAALEHLKEQKKRLSAMIKKQRDVFEYGRIPLNDIQKAVWEFMEQELGLRGSLETPHLTGEKSVKKGELQIHFQTLFPLWGDEVGFNWQKGEPFIADLTALNTKWKVFLEMRFGVKIEGDLANPQYAYVLADGKNIADLTKLAFWVRYDHRIEAGGAFFPILAQDKEACKVLRMTTRQRYTRGYGCLSDRNLASFQLQWGGTLLKDKLIEMGDGEAKDVEGQWEVLTKQRLSEDVPFVGFIRKDGKHQEDLALKEIVGSGLDNLPVVAEKKGDVVFVWYTGEEPKDGESAYEVCVFHKKLGVWSIWKKHKKGEQNGEQNGEILCRLPGDEQKHVDYQKEPIEFVLSYVVGKLPDNAEESANGFFVWNGKEEDEQVTEEITESNISHENDFLPVNLKIKRDVVAIRFIGVTDSQKLYAESMEEFSDGFVSKEDALSMLSML